MEQIKSKIREISNWPKKGVKFKDITPLLEDRKSFNMAVNALASPYVDKKIDKVAGIDARGFIFAGALAYKLKSGMAIIRKKGKLPSTTISKEYALEYGDNTIEMHKDSILPGEKILLVDDVLATGGTMEAAVCLIKQLKGKIAGICFLVEIKNLRGRKKLKNYKITSLAQY